MKPFNLVLLLLAILAFTACNSEPPAPPATAEATTEIAQAAATDTPAPTAPAEKVTIRWYVGLGIGSEPQQVEAQKEVVADFNATHPNINLEIEIVENRNHEAYDQLKASLATGEAPDVIGPVGVRGGNEFKGAWLDLTDLVTETNYDLRQFDQKAVDFYRDEKEGLTGIPFAIFPSFIYYNRDLFDQAKLPYPPQEYGKPYADGDPWTVEKLAKISLQLTLDAKGRNATDPDFDPKTIKQFGFVPQWSEPRRMATMFGAGNFVDEQNQAVMPDAWRAAFTWYYDGMWQHRFMPNGADLSSELLEDNPFATGHVAMANTHLWYTCCLDQRVPNWDIAVMPTYDGQATAALHADTFKIINTTKHPKEAFEVLTYLVGKEAAPKLLLAYGGMPARQSYQAVFFGELDKKFPQRINWQVVLDSLKVADKPSHEAWMPNFAKADERIKTFQTLMENEGDLDLDKELDTLVSDLQSIFKSQ